MQRKVILCAIMIILMNLSEAQLLYQVSGNGLDKSSYIFGTIHFVCDEDQLDEIAAAALKNSKKVFLELDMDDPSLSSKMQKLMLDLSAKEDYAELDELDYQRLNQFLLDNYGTGLDQMSAMKPFALMSMVMLKSIECEQFTSVEELVMKEAKRNHLGIYGLETIEFQMGLFDDIPFEDQMDWIWETLDSDFQYEYGRMLDAYNDGDLEELYDLILDSPGFANYIDKLLNDRNLNWMPIIQKEMSKQPTFFAVGAGHLAGNMGVLELLREEGYQVQPVVGGKYR
jgi:uncharacterized protein YbaP (TraB family)